MLKLFAIYFFLFLAMPVVAQEMPESLDFFSTKGISVEFVKIHDPGFIVLKTSKGALIDTTYQGVDFDTLYDWESQQKKSGKARILQLNYTNKKGVQVYDPKTKTRFRLNGVIKQHPIDDAQAACEDKYSTTHGIAYCGELGLAAWDAELNRAYRDLGGRKKAKLKKAQLAWIKFRDAQIEYLREEYGSRDGTIWRLVYIGHVIKITKNQANFLKNIGAW